jgi:hypothetical protein
MVDMTNEEKKARDIEDALKKHDAAKADAEAGTQMDKLLSCLDSMTSKFESFSSRLDAMETGMMDSKKKSDAEGEEIKEKGDPRESSVDSARADSAEIISELATIQSYADRADSAWSKTSPSPWQMEMPDAYRRRLAAGHQKHSDLWKDCDLHDLKGAALKNACQAIFADSIVASKNMEAIGAMNLREVTRRGEGGHLIKEYFGDPLAWMAQFPGNRRVAKFNFPRSRD